MGHSTDSEVKAAHIWVWGVMVRLTSQENVALSPLRILGVEEDPTAECFDGDILTGKATSHVGLSMASNMESVICSSALDVSVGLASSVLICTRFNLSFFVEFFPVDGSVIESFWACRWSVCEVEGCDDGEVVGS